MKATLILVWSAVLLVAGCDEPAPWARPPTAAQIAQSSATVRVQPVTWNDFAGRFEFGDQPVKVGRLWTFDGSTEGFVLTGGEVLPATPQGLNVRNVDPDPILRSPKGLALRGDRYSLVLIRLTRHRAGGSWDGALFYSTLAHGESADFRAKPLEGAAPAVGETVILVYDMLHLKKGGDDWVNSLIDGLRIDTDDQPGGVFTIHQVAISENPGLLALGVKSPSPAEAKPTPAPGA